MTAQAYQRLLDLALALTSAGSVGVTTPALMEKVGYEHNDAGKRAMARDIDELRKTGLTIENVNERGEDGRYVLEPGDYRWRLEFSTAQHNALQAALVVAESQGVVEVAVPNPPIDLERVKMAVQAHCQMGFIYNGKRRTVDPLNWGWSDHTLVVQGWEHESGIVKTFAIERIEGLDLRSPGSATTRDTTNRPGLDPLTWHLDPVVTAVLRCPDYAQDVVDLVGGDVVGDEVHVEVTNRLVFLARVLELGSRVVLVAPEELRDELRALLQEAL